MNFTKKAHMVALASAITLPMLANASPVAPEQKPVPVRFSAEVLANFELYADSDNNKLVWYVPKYGSVAMLGTPSNPVPRFNANYFTEFSGAFAGQTVAVLGGSFSTAGFAPQRTQLQNEANSLGVQIAPAQAKKATTKFIVSGLDTDGKLHANCTTTKLLVTNPVTGVTTEVSMPKCEVVYEDGTIKEVDTIQKFTALVPTGQTSVSTSIPFQAKTTPDYTNSVTSNLASGANFDESLSAVVDWEIPTSSITRTARFTINYNQVFEKATTFAAIHNWACVDIEVSTFFQRLVRDGSIKVEYLNANNQWVLNAPNASDFVGAVAALEREIRNEIFAEMTSYAQPNLPNVSRQASAVFTLRANYEKQIFSVNETRVFNYNPGPVIKTARTDMFVGCLTGGFGTPVVASTAPNCKALFGI
ncbi:MAG: hypothetical protein B0W54_00775 [Cellvibrio sp. 79]|nr:MAG: hypothetical protein B0W54_00775 [Cellvibrio sp. 79]